jgi:hypothetical protein
MGVMIITDCSWKAYSFGQPVVLGDEESKMKPTVLLRPLQKSE